MGGKGLRERIITLADKCKELEASYSRQEEGPDRQGTREGGLHGLESPVL